MFALPQIERRLCFTRENHQIVRKPYFSPALRPNHAHIVGGEELNDYAAMVEILSERWCEVVFIGIHDLPFWGAPG